MMAGGSTNGFKVVVLSGNAHALLGGCGAGVVSLFEADKKVSELDHARVDEHQGGVTVWDQRGALDLLVPTVGKKVEKRSTEVVRCLLCHAGLASTIDFTPSMSWERLG